MRQTTFTIVLILLIAATGFVWLRYIRQSPSPDPEATLNIPSPVDEAQLAYYRQLRSLKFDFSILSDPAFLSLGEVPPPPAPAFSPGRANPFVPF
ncbi:MAG: hypothetical protein AAB650_01650 [Patescibacteria group bacterium]